MFGFTQSPTTCCQKASHSVYKSHFCGLSCRLRQDYGHSARFLVNRDSTFLSLLGSALSRSPNSCQLSTCCNPLSTPSALWIDSDVQSYSAAVAVCGLSAKCEDDRHDHTGPRALLAKSIFRGTSGWRDTALATLNSTGFPTAQTIAYLQQQESNESPNSSISQAAESTALAFQNIFDHLGKLVCPKPPSELATVGFSLGQLIYLRDAVDDLQKDLKNDHYNPLRYRNVSELVSLATTAQSNFSKALQALPLNRHQEVVGAIHAQTTSFHQDLLNTPSPRASKKGKKISNSSRWWHHCDCCCCDCGDCGSCGNKGSGCDAPDCCDSCGGCDSCNCCDGCDCCSCS